MNRGSQNRKLPMASSGGGGSGTAGISSGHRNASNSGGFLLPNVGLSFFPSAGGSSGRISSIIGGNMIALSPATGSSGSGNSSAAALLLSTRIRSGGGLVGNVRFRFLLGLLLFFTVALLALLMTNGGGRGPLGGSESLFNVWEEEQEAATRDDSTGEQLLGRLQDVSNSSNSNSGVDDDALMDKSANHDDASPEKVAESTERDESAGTAVGRGASLDASPCPASCSLHGTCNPELARCDCVAGYTGPDCAELAMPSCQLADGYSMPCFQQVTCHCARECDKFHLSHEMQCFDASQILQGDKEMQKSQGGENGVTPLLTWQQVLAAPEAQLTYDKKGTFIRLKEVKKARNLLDPPENCPANCSRRGSCMGSSRECLCPWFYSGEGCADVAAGCLNECSGRGKCEEGVCRCEKHFFGIDCSLSLDENQQPRLQRSQDDSLSKAEATRPRIFVYELPGYFNTWQFRHSPAIDLPEAVWLLERLLSSPYRTANPDEADFFYVPLFLRNRDHGRRALLLSALNFIRTTHPFFDRSHGQDHFLMISDQFARCTLFQDMSGKADSGHLAKLMEHVTVLTPWGFPRALGNADTSPLDWCFIPAYDIVIPPMVPLPFFSESPLLSLEKDDKAPPPKRVLLMVQGQLSDMDDMISSVGSNLVATIKVMEEDPQIRIWDGSQEGGGGSLWEAILDAEFCFLPDTLGWRHDLVMSILGGCIPVVVEPVILKPFQKFLIDWEDVSLKIPRAHLKNVARILRKVSAEQKNKKLEAMRHIWTKLAWRGPGYDPLASLPEDSAAFWRPVFEREDAFQSIMAALEMKRTGREGGSLAGDESQKEDENGGNNLDIQAAGDGVDQAVQETQENEDDAGEDMERSKESLEGAVTRDDVAASDLLLPNGKISSCSPQCAGKGGTCNEEEGRCDCPPNLTGPDCAEPAMPSCHVGNGLYTPCSFAGTCACYLDCDRYRLDHNVVCFDEREELPPEQTEGGGEEEEDASKAEEAVKEDGERKDEKEKPALMVTVGDSSIDAMKIFHLPQVFFVTDGRGHEVQKRTRIDPHEFYRWREPYVHPSYCPSSCSGRGVCNKNSLTCECPWIFWGNGCEIVEAAPVVCINGCSGRGECRDGICICRPGYFGADCSLLVDPEGRTRILKRPTFNWPEVANLKATPLPLEDRPDEISDESRPLIYVYDLPSHFNTWQFHHSHQLDWVEPVVFLERILNSPFRTADASKADFFYVPLFIRNRDAARHAVVEWAIDYIKTKYPYWNKTNGADHMFLSNSDWGPCEIGPLGLRDPLLSNSMMLTLWGFARNMFLKKYDTCFIANQDIVLPPFLEPAAYRLSPFLRPPGEELPERTMLLYFTGYNATTAKTFDKYRWSLRVRQAFAEEYDGREEETGVVIKKTKGFPDYPSPTQYLEDMLRSKFCFAPCGWGWGMRATQAVVMGCIPVVIQPEVFQPFEGDGVDWTEFAVMLRFSDIPRLHEILKEMPEEEVVRKQQKMAEVWPRFTWTSWQVNLLQEVPPEQQQAAAKRLEEDDVFMTLIDALKLRLKMKEKKEKEKERDGSEKSSDAGDASASSKREGAGEEGPEGAASEWQGQSKCSEECFEHGTCNEELGKCFCEEGFTGEDCSQLAMPACHLAPGYRSPCFLFTSCSCAMQCDSFALFHERTCFDESTIIDGNGHVSLSELYKQQQFDLYTNGRGLEVSERREVSAAGGVFTDLEQCPGGCSGIGACEGAIKTCRCPSTHEGSRCHWLTSPSTSSSSSSLSSSSMPFLCFNGCSSRGSCQLGVCRCNRGFFGIDCSLTMGSKGSEIVQPKSAFRWSSVPLPPLPAPPSSAASLRPKVFVYDLPGQFNTWQWQHVALREGWDALIFFERLLASPFRTADPNEADFFFVPLFLRQRTFAARDVLTWAIEYISSNYPFWSQSEGRNHVFFAENERGSCEIGPYGFREKLLDNSIVITPWSYTLNMLASSESPCFIKGQDVAVPPLLPVEIYSQSPFLPSQASGTKKRETFFYFYGDDGREEFLIDGNMSLGVRQKIFDLFEARKEANFRLIKGSDAPEDSVLGMRRATFCLATTGFGSHFSTAQSLLMGCIPVIIQPDVALPFEEYDIINWSDVAVVLSFSDIPQLDTILGSISQDEIEKKREKMREVWHRLVWASPQFNPFQGAGQVDDEVATKLAEADAFMSTMEVLKRRLSGESSEESKLNKRHSNKSRRKSKLRRRSGSSQKS